jgi:mono/diheme cytochrome c family protein
MRRTPFLLALLAAGCGEPPGDTTTAIHTDRGAYLVEHLLACPACHTPRDDAGTPLPGAALAGWECLLRAPDGGCLNSRNLTAAPTGLANRSDDELRTMITAGVRPPATRDAPLHPTMPYWMFHNLAAADVDAVIAHLRTVTAVDRPVPRSAPAFDREAPAPALDPASLPLPPVADPRALRGRALAAQTGCLDCHTPRTADGALPAADRYFRGGRPLMLPPPTGTVVAPSLRGRPGWTAAGVVTALRTGAGQGGPACPPPFAGPGGAYAGLTDADAGDLAAYLVSLP